MGEVRPQACPAAEQNCCDSATAGEGIDSGSWNLQLSVTISTHEQGVRPLVEDCASEGSQAACGIRRGRFAAEPGVRCDQLEEASAGGFAELRFDLLLHSRQR